MPDAHAGVDADRLASRLPAVWRVEDDGAGVYGYADGRHPTDRLIRANGEVPACFSIRPAGELWVATWKAPHPLHGDPGPAAEQVTGIKERCVEWIVERAAPLKAHLDG